MRCSRYECMYEDISDIENQLEIQNNPECPNRLENRINGQINGPATNVIKHISESYTGDGNLKMDKKYNAYCRENQELIIESEYISNMSLKDVLKNYILETQRNRIGMAARKSECYNTINMIVAAPKEVC